MKTIILLLALYAPFVYSQDLTPEQKIVAMTIVGEARGEGKLGMHVVACVIAQRATEWKRNGKSITAKQVCLQKWQFSCWNPKDPNRPKLLQLLDTPAGAYAKYLAVNLNRLDRKFTGNADHYCHLNKKPNWIYKTVKKDGKTIRVLIDPIKVIGNHKFYKLR
jgi:hypothetical protein